VEYFIDKKRTYAKERVAALQGKYAVLEHANESFNTVNNPGESPTGDKQSRTDEMMQESFEAHIDFLAPYVQTWPSALALFADPMQISVSMTTGMQIADDIVTLGGIEASRNDWYTERLLAVMLYTSTELFLLSDKSPNFSDTRFVPGVLSCRVVAQVLVRLLYPAVYSALWGLYARQHHSRAGWRVLLTQDEHVWEPHISIVTTVCACCTHREFLRRNIRTYQSLRQAPNAGSKLRDVLLHMFMEKK
jgi:rpsU-divergently transcribed protein